MAIYSISYDLNKNGQNYDGLINEIKKSPDWCKPTESYWFISTRESANQVYERLSKYIDRNDYLIVIKVGGQYQGWLPNAIWGWLKKHTYDLI